jgi:hypothetical protein
MLTKNLPFIDSADALEAFLDAWKSGTLTRAAFTHAAHVAVAATFAFDHDPAEAFRLTKEGIQAFNASVGVVSTETSGYHETLTRFWSQVIGKFVRDGGFASRLDAVRAAVEVYGERRNLYKKYYSFDVVADRRARREWVPPDLYPGSAHQN